MMNEPGSKYLFFFCSVLMLAFMLYQSRDAGISCDEVLHYQQSVAVVKYFSSHGADRSALDTPVSHLKYYGQSYDNIVTILAGWLNIENIYGFRHVMSSLAGWLTVFITALFAVWLAGYVPGIIVIIMYAISPTFLGHSMNNLKDIPFALGYIASLFFTIRVLFRGRKILLYDVFLLILSIGFSISIRAGGLLMICYLFFFYLISVYTDYFRERSFQGKVWGKKLLIIILVSGAAFFLGILLWPFALEDPFKNVLQSYRVMAHFPSTFRQIFEGRNEWSDFMPWYYLPKSMLLTIPLAISGGLLFSFRLFKTGKSLLSTLLFFALLFPVFFAIAGRSNLYSSWRQFLFLYPVIVLLSAVAIFSFAESIRNKLVRWGFTALLLLVSVHPVNFMISNHPYEYLYYNQLTGGLKGAYGNYETDYYYTGQTEASKWLTGYLQEKKQDSAIVGATFTVEWLFRKMPGVKTVYFRNEERSQFDWDYAIITNRYISPYILKNKLWPPSDAIHVICADSIPVCAVIERTTKAGYDGYKALEEGNDLLAADFLRKAVAANEPDEMIFYNFARALYNLGEYQKADSVLKKVLEFNPDFEPVLMYLGNIEAGRGNREEAAGYFEKLISVNRKYFDAYLSLSGLYAEEDVLKARKLLRTCLAINPGYRQAVKALADTYRKTDPAIARKYDELAETMN